MKHERGNVLLRQLDRLAGIPLVLPGAFYRKVGNLVRPKRQPARIGILCVGAIGDLLLVSALVNGIRKCAPCARLELTASCANASALPLLPDLDDTFSLSITRPLAFLAHLRSRKYDVLIDTGQWARITALLCAGSGAGITVGFSTPGQYRAMGYDIPVAHRKRHELENFCALGSAIWPQFSGEAKLNLPPWQRRRKVICCHMWPSSGPGREMKEWPREYWAELVEKLLPAGFEIGLTGGGADVEATEDFLKRYFPDHPKVRALASLPLVELGRYFTQIAAVVSVNSGPMHLAALANVPTVGLHGATNPGRWGPVGANAIAVQPRRGEFGYLNLGFEYPANVKSAMASLPVADVLEALGKLRVL